MNGLDVHTSDGKTSQNFKQGGSMFKGSLWSLYRALDRDEEDEMRHLFRGRN